MYLVTENNIYVMIQTKGFCNSSFIQYRRLVLPCTVSVKRAWLSLNRAGYLRVCTQPNYVVKITKCNLRSQYLIAEVLKSRLQHRLIQRLDINAPGQPNIRGIQCMFNPSCGVILYPHVNPIQFLKTYVIDVDTSRTPEEGANSPSWPNGLVIIIIYSICVS
jgi:hypothetical protein